MLYTQPRPKISISSHPIQPTVLHPSVDGSVISKSVNIVGLLAKKGVFLNLFPRHIFEKYLGHILRALEGVFLQLTGEPSPPGCLRPHPVTGLKQKEKLCS